MKPRRWLFALTLAEAITLLSAIQAAAEGDRPLGVVQGLYQFDLKHFGFDEKVIKAERLYFAPDLYARLLKKANQPVAPGDAPDIEGDVVFNAQDKPTRYVVGKASIDNGDAKVGVDLAWDSEKRHYTVLLKQIDGAWKVTDIDFGKDGKLSDLLK